MSFDPMRDYTKRRTKQATPSSPPKRLLVTTNPDTAPNYGWKRQSSRAPMIDFSFDPLLDSLNMAAKTLHEWATQVTKSFNRVSKSYMPKPDLEIELCSISKKTGENIGECTVNIYDDQGCKIGSFHAEDITINK